ncbi:MAG: beta-CASP ribonuclease aCPSF1, partial [Candidatus Aenigmatarchaeota archaeon]
MDYAEVTDITPDIRLTFYNAGHILGSALVHLHIGEGWHNLLYTGDFKTTDTKLLTKADEDLPEIDYLITESTYSDREHADRKSQEKELVRIINDTISNEGIVLVSGFAVGRIQELLLVLDKYGIDYPLYIDGMAKKATTIINQYASLLKEPRSLDKALQKVKYVSSERHRKQ